MKQLRCCVVIPTYNNGRTLGTILDGVMQFTDDVIIVNDGSTDTTQNILENYLQVKQLHLPKNIGKGNALKNGFAYALSLGFDHAITLDSDGQHFPSDIPVFVEALENSEHKNILLIGDRNMDEADVFASSRRGNRISTYWVKAVTGLGLRDSQSGFRLYPIRALQNVRFFRNTRKFEYEVEVIVRAHWKDIPVLNVPIQISYEEEGRVSHFRPFMDIARIVVLIIWFLIVKYTYIVPRNLFRRLKKKGFKKFFTEDFLRNSDSPKKKALSIALGIFFGLSPLWGFHTVIVLFMAILLKLNKVIAFAFSNISLPPFIPFVLFLSLQTGSWVLGEDSFFTLEEIQKDFDLLKHLESYLVGSIILSVSAAITIGLLGYAVLSVTQPKKIAHDG